MKAYINKDLKELIITLASVIGFGDVLVKTGRLHQEDEDAAKLMMGAATTISMPPRACMMRTVGLWKLPECSIVTKRRIKKWSG